MRFLLTSLLLMLCISCTSYPKRNHFNPTVTSRVSILNPYFSDTAQDYIYRANIKAFDKNFSGIFIVKKLGIEHHRIAFTTELGNKIFDFTFEGDKFKVNHIVKELDKKLLINVLRNDFEVLVKENPLLEKTFVYKKDTVYQTTILGKDHFHFCRQKQLYKITQIKRGKHKVEFLFSEINDDLANYIEINHRNLRLSIRLKSI